MGILQHRHPKITKPEPPPEDPVAFGEWLDRPPARYFDEAPEAPESIYHDPEPGEDVMFFDGPIFEPDASDLSWLREQQAVCEKLGWDTAELDGEIRRVERSLVIAEVARFLARSREGHDS